MVKSVQLLRHPILPENSNFSEFLWKGIYKIKHPNNNEQYYKTFVIYGELSLFSTLAMFSLPLELGFIIPNLYIRKRKHKANDLVSDVLSHNY